MKGFKDWEKVNLFVKKNKENRHLQVSSIIITENENEGDDDDTLDDPIQLVVEAGHGVRGLRSTENQQVLQRIMCGTSQHFLQIINQYSDSTKWFSSYLYRSSPSTPPVQYYSVHYNTHDQLQ